jgi:hypothetical protein
MQGRKPFDFPNIHVIYRATPVDRLRPDLWLIAEN